MTRIALDGVTVERGGHLALDDVSTIFDAGTVTAVIGPSGAGKSTLLGVIAGLVAMTRGRTRFDDVDAAGLAAEERKLGVVFQDLRLFDFLTGRANVSFGPRVAGLPAGEQHTVVEEALRHVRAERFADRLAAVLSGGERQRIALARALATRPRALLLDEPFSSLDADLRQAIRADVRRIVSDLGLTTVLVTHDRDDAFALASRIIVLRDGRVEQCGDAADLYARPKSAYVATLLGEANLLPFTRRDAATIEIGAQTLAATGSGTHALLRPEAIVVSADGPGWRATVVEAQFAGGSWRLTLALGSLGTIVARTPHRPDADAVVVGVPVAVHTV